MKQRFLVSIFGSQGPQTGDGRTSALFAGPRPSSRATSKPGISSFNFTVRPRQSRDGARSYQLTELVLKALGNALGSARFGQTAAEGQLVLNIAPVNLQQAPSIQLQVARGFAVQ